MIIIDDARVFGLVATKLQDLVSGGEVSVLLPGEPDPASGGENENGRAPMTWCRLLAVDVLRRPRTRREDEPAIAEVAVTINVVANRTATLETATALHRAAALVMDVIGEQTLRHTASTHQLDLRQPEFTADVEPDEQRGLTTGVIIIRGIVTRTAQGSASLVKYGATPTLLSASMATGGGVGTLTLTFDRPVAAGTSVSMAMQTRGFAVYANTVATAFGQGTVVTLPMIEQNLDIGANVLDYTGTYLVGLNGVAVPAFSGFPLTVT